MGCYGKKQDYNSSLLPSPKVKMHPPFRLLSRVLELIFNDYVLDVFDPGYKRRVFTEPF